MALLKFLDSYSVILTISIATIVTITIITIIISISSRLAKKIGIKEDEENDEDEFAHETRIKNYIKNSNISNLHKSLLNTWIFALHHTFSIVIISTTIISCLSLPIAISINKKQLEKLQKQGYTQLNEKEIVMISDKCYDRGLLELAKKDIETKNFHGRIYVKEK